MGAILTVIGLTGSVLVFFSEIDHAINPSLYYAQDSSTTSRLSFQEIIDIARREAPTGWVSAGAAVPKSTDENYVFGYWVKNPTPAPEEAISLNIAINPYTGKVEGRRVFYHAWNPLKHCFVGFFFKLHYSLLFSEFFHDWGNIVVGFVTFFFLVSVLTGLILWWPLSGKWKSALIIKKQASPIRFNHDLHKISGFYSMLVLLAVLFTGISFNLPDEFRWTVKRFSPLMAEPEPVRPSPNQSQQTVDQLIAKAQQKYRGGRLSYITVTDGNTSLMTACFENVPSLKRYVIDSGCVVIDSSSGDFVQTQDPASGSAGDTFMLWQWSLHSGQAFGWTGRILVFISGIACAVLFVTGVIRWLQKRRSARFSENRHTKVKDYRA